MTSSSDTIHVALASDAKYAMPLTVAICSAATNCDRRRRLMFYIIHNDIPSVLQKKIERSLAATGFPEARIHWIPIEAEQQFVDLPLERYFTPMIYARLLIPFLLPPDLDKALYLDCDLVVVGDLAEVWDFDFDGKALLAVRDRIGTVGGLGGLKNHRELGIPPSAKFFNSGVLLINMRKWRSEKISQSVFDYLRRHSALGQLDQEGLNAVLFDDWKELPFRWNWQVPWRMYRLEKRTMQWLPDDNVKHVIHFTTAEKPWLPGCDVEEKQSFFEYLDRTEWAGWRVPVLYEVLGRSRRFIDDVRTLMGALRRGR
jgi:lipopolysaccharide biosynthesis glycosyltransferase